MPATTTQTNYGTYTHGKPYWHNSGCGITWYRSDLYTPHNGERAEYDRAFVAGPDDDSPIYTGERHSCECGLCYLNFTHSEQLHAERVQGKQEQTP